MGSSIGESSLERAAQNRCTSNGEGEETRKGEKSKQGRRKEKREMGVFKKNHGNWERGKETWHQGERETRNSWTIVILRRSHE